MDGLTPDYQLANQYYTSDSEEERKHIISLLWDQHFGFIYLFLINRFPQTPEDELQIVTSDLFAIELPKTLSEKGNQFTTARSIRKWLLKAAKNRAIDLVRRLNSQFDREEEFRFFEKSFEKSVIFNDALRSIDKTERLEMEEPDFNETSIKLAIGLLPQLQQDCLIEYYFSGLSYEEIAEKHQITHAQVRGALYHGKKKLSEVSIQNIQSKPSFAKDWFNEKQFQQILLHLEDTVYQEINNINQLIQLVINLLPEEQISWINDYIREGQNLLELAKKYNRLDFPSEFTAAFQKINTAMGTYLRMEKITKDGKRP